MASPPRDTGSTHPLAVRRRLVGLKQEDLSDMVGVSVSTISKIESGRTRDPSIRLMINIAMALHCRLEDVWPHEWAQLSPVFETKRPTKDEVLSRREGTWYANRPPKTLRKADD